MPARFEFRIRYAKVGRCRFLSGNDLLRLFDRASRRANLPVAMSQGFNPRPKLSLLSALGVGTEGLNEVLDIELVRPMAPEKLAARLDGQLPEGVDIRDVRILPPGAPKIVERIAFSVRPISAVNLSAEKVKQLLARETLPVERRTKRGARTVDIRPFIEDLRIENDALLMRLRVLREGTTRPEEILKLLGAASDTFGTLLLFTRTHVEIAHR